MSLGAVLGVEEESLFRGQTKPIEYIVTERGCWECISHVRDRQGYVHIERSTRVYLGHRYVYELLVKPIEEGMYLCHKCDNPPCVNPSHMFEGTRQDNIEDAVLKLHFCNKLTPESVLYVREQWTAGKTQKEIADELEVNPSLISRILSGKYWGWM